jgi:hypothetical protein
MIVKIGIAAALCCGMALGQSPSPTAPAQPAASKSAADDLVDQLIANAALYRTTLPSLTAHEKIVSDASILLYKPHAEAEATVRVLRKVPGGPLVESREYTLLNGKQVAPDKHVVLPTNIYDGFDGFQEIFFSAQRRRCFNFTLAPQIAPSASLDLHITLKPDAASLPICPSDMQGLTGIARVDPAAHQLKHLEWTVPQAAEQRVQVLSASTDYAPTSIGTKTFWLPIDVVQYAINSKNKAKGHFTVHYSDYHQYTATSTILPADPEQSVP